MGTSTFGMGYLVIVLFVFAMLGAWIWALVDILKSNFKDGITKIIWLLVVFFLSFLGVILYVIMGKSTKVTKEVAEASSKFENLGKLKELLDSGAITQEEFEAEKSKLMK